MSELGISVLVVLRMVDGSAIPDAELQLAIDKARRQAHIVLELGEPSVERQRFPDGREQAVVAFNPAVRSKIVQPPPGMVLPNLAEGERFR